MDKILSFFKVNERGSSLSTEVTAGTTTFLAMAYILAVNPMILSGTGMNSGAVFTATCVSAFIGTMMMALFANYPVALASGMGLNAYFASVCAEISTERPWEVVLAAIFVEGIIFILLSFTNFREKLVNDISDNLKYGITIGIGLFIAMLGLKNSGAIVADAGNLALGDLGTVPVALTFVGVIIIAFLHHKNIKGSIILGMLATWAIGIVLQLIGVYEVNETNFSLIPSFDFSSIVPTAPYFLDFDFSWIGSHIMDFVVIVFAFLYVDIFDTIGTLIGVSSKAGLLDKDGNLPMAKEALLSDAVGTVAGACLGTSTVTSYVESSAGAAAGGKTGLSSVVTALLFIVSLLFAPIFTTMPTFATSPALIFVGLLMFENIKLIKFEGVDIADVIGAFMAIIMMPLTASISTGIMFAILSWIILKVLCGKVKEIPGVMWVSGALFFLYMFKDAIAGLF